MGDKSAIEWTDATWPIVQGCDPVSQGCVHCYAVPLLWRLAHNPNETISGPLKGLVEGYTPADGETILRFTGKLALREDRLTWPLKWKTPRMIFVPSHGDIFHKDVPDKFLDKIFAVMALRPQHTFQVLTKRAERMREYCSHHSGAAAAFRIWMQMPKLDKAATGCDQPHWPLPNVWLGVSCERQQEADERIPHLMATPAAVRFISAEPLLGPIIISYLEWARLDWVIVGGESGKDARPMHPQWARDLRDQCEVAGIAFFFKQWGEYAPQAPRGAVRFWRGAMLAKHVVAHDYAFMRVGKKAAGRLLDGREHSAFPVIDRSVTQSGVAVEPKRAEATHV